MKREWKNFRLDKNKCKRFLGQVVFTIIVYVSFELMFIYGFMTATTLN